LRRADAIFIDELRAAPFQPAVSDPPARRRCRTGTRSDNWYDATAQAFAVFLP
jgi:GMP synthase (glutamine-hydrolysing)